MSHTSSAFPRAGFLVQRAAVLIPTRPSSRNGLGWPSIALRGPRRSGGHAVLITAWKSLLQEGAADVFGPGVGASNVPAVDVKSLHAKIGELTLENDS